MKATVLWPLVTFAAAPSLRPMHQVEQPALPSIAVDQSTPRAPEVRAAHADSTARWTFVIDQRFGERPGAELVDPQTLGVDAAGRLYVVDARPAAIKVFNPDGTLLRTIGRPGGGPGEFRSPWIAVRGTHVVLHDPGLSRTSVFDTSGRFVRSWSSFCCHQNEIAIDKAGRVVIPAVVRGEADASLSIRFISYVRYQLDGTLIDTLRIRTTADERLWTVAREGAPGKTGGFTSMNIPFTPKQLYAHHPGGGFVTGWSGTYQIARSAGGRDSMLLVSRRWTPRRLPAGVRQAQVDTAILNFARMVGDTRAREAVHLSDVPLAEPAFTRLLVDEDGNTWARRLLGGDAAHSEMDVFAPGGAYLGRATLPVALPEWGGTCFGRGVVYVRTENPDGQPVVIRLVVSRS